MYHMDFVTPEKYTDKSDVAIRWLLLGTAYFLVFLFIIGVFDILLNFYIIFETREFTDPVAIIELIETVLLLLIIVEVHKTLIAYVEERPITRIVIGVGIVAVARIIIALRPTELETGVEAILISGSLSLLLLVLVISYYVLGKTNLSDEAPTVSK